ncbi:MAG: hypothetical protein ACAH88_10360 [Roseimicrobium sp.]
MSRRTKLLITALFLVLLGIPTAYVARTWHPENPLRFHLDEESREPDPFDPKEDHRVLKITIENTSNTPVCVLDALLIFRDAKSGTEQAVGWASLDRVLGGRAIVPVHVPPKGVMPCSVLVDDAFRDCPLDHVHVQSTWMSVPKSYFARVCLWLEHRLPRKLSSHLPIPSAGEDEGPLILPATVPNRPSLPEEDPFRDSNSQ